ncbi:MAG: nucleotidyltransferase domain-containing protein [Burkholderiales bacterium]
MNLENRLGQELVLAPNQLATVTQVLNTHAAHHRAFVFGSRVVLSSEDRQRLKPHSDLDLALEGPPLQPEQTFALREAFSESGLPMRVDVVDASELPTEWNLRAWPL